MKNGTFFSFFYQLKIIQLDLFLFSVCFRLGVEFAIGPGKSILFSRIFRVIVYRPIEQRKVSLSISNLI